jgi:fatty-acyl-CoA synthase
MPDTLYFLSFFDHFSSLLRNEIIMITAGMTETGPVSFQTSITDDVVDRCETVGTVHPHVECKVVDEQGQTVAPNTRGELLTKVRPCVLNLGSGFVDVDEQERAVALIPGASY